MAGVPDDQRTANELMDEALAHHLD
mgnify:CR=1